MSLDQLTKTPSGSPTTSSKPNRLPTWLLPVGLALGFLLVFALLFGSRLIPAQKVETAPVVTIRATNSEEPPTPTIPDEAQTPNALPTGPLLFQASGWIEPDPYVTFVTSLIDGVIDEVHVLEGQQVKKDQLLASLIADDAELDVQQAKQRITSLESKNIAHCAIIPVLKSEQDAARKKVAAEQAFLEELEDTANRLGSVNKGGISEIALTKAKLGVIRQKATLAESEAEIPRFAAKIKQVHKERTAIDNEVFEAQTDLARKQLALDRCKISAPMDGIVLRLHAAPGKKRMLGMDDPKSAVIVELYDPQKLQTRIDVPLNEAAGLSVGQPVKFTTDLLPDLEMTGTVTRIVGEADLQRNTLQAKVRINNPHPRLRPEMLVRAEFYNAGSSSTPNSAISTPQSNSRLSLYALKTALFDISGATASAWVLADNSAQLRKLSLGVEERDDHIHVHSGLHSGDLLILPPHNKLTEGKRVRQTDL
ncbi:MAG: efflux RND transporter periplasmic adaptor subunit [Akkermansiaceae bacterium]|nr:efflux RND transporter periplasmic adaptor subunit [Akkermansiaceae bacterium]